MTIIYNYNNIIINSISIIQYNVFILYNTYKLLQYL